MWDVYLYESDYPALFMAVFHVASGERVHVYEICLRVYVSVVFSLVNVHFLWGNGGLVKSFLLILVLCTCLFHSLSASSCVVL